MFDFLRRKAVPPLLRDNPGDSARLTLETEDGSGQRLEYDLPAILAGLLRDAGISAKRRGDSLWLDDGLILQPRFLECEGGRNGLRTVTTLQVDHARLMPRGLFEFQHAWAATLEQSLHNGFDQWLKTDLATLRDALRPEPAQSMTMRFELPDGRVRRAVFGPFSHFMDAPPLAGTAEAEEAEKFCPCCLFTNAIDGLRPLLEAQGTVGLRMFASRNADGAEADCRANGIDHPEGAEALRAYARGWLPKCEIEFRKQYVVLHDVPAESAPVQRASHH